MSYSDPRATAHTTEKCEQSRILNSLPTLRGFSFNSSPLALNSFPETKNQAFPCLAAQTWSCSCSPRSPTTRLSPAPALNSALPRSLPHAHPSCSRSPAALNPSHSRTCSSASPRSPPALNPSHSRARPPLAPRFSHPSPPRARPRARWVENDCELSFHPFLAMEHPTLRASKGLSAESERGKTGRARGASAGGERGGRARGASAGKTGQARGA